MEPNENPNCMLLESILDGNFQQAKIALEQGANNLDVALVTAASMGHVRIVQCLIKNNAPILQKAFELGCGSGETKVVEMLGVPIRQLNYGQIPNEYLEKGMSAACSNGHLDMVKYLEESFEYEDWNRVLQYACGSAQFKIINYAIQQKRATDWDSGLRMGCFGGHMRVVNRMIAKGARNWDEGLQWASMGGQVDVARFMILTGATNYSQGLERACQHGHLEVAKLLLEHTNEGIESGMYFACQFGKYELVKLMISKSPRNWNSCLAVSVKRDSVANVICSRLMISNGATNLNVLERSNSVILKKHFFAQQVDRLRELVKQHDPVYAFLVHPNDCPELDWMVLKYLSTF